MENSLIPMRFVRIKAFQNLYTYTISQRVCKREVVEEIEKKFHFDLFLHKSDEKLRLDQEKEAAIALFQKMVGLDRFEDVEVGNGTIQQTVKQSFVRYKQLLLQEQQLLQAKFSQAKEQIYKGYGYTLLLLIEWYKLAQADTVTPPVDLLKDQLAAHPLLKALSDNTSWINLLKIPSTSWNQEENKVKTWYAQFIKPLKPLLSSLKNRNDETKILEYIIQSIIFKEPQIESFFSMMDLSWHEHKRVVKKMLHRTFLILATKDITAFASFLGELELEWTSKIAFYNYLFEQAIAHGNDYEELIHKTAEKWKSDRMVLVDKIIVKLALVEMLASQQTPFKVSLNEYIELAKLYGTSKSGQFVNGILEGIYKGFKEDPL
ncbi:MAG: transcription antitermination protein NusB [Amoebophilaceae bacterium]|nr:transcription antitermination protein NusB [Amoebophilaceae bacterium]